MANKITIVQKLKVTGVLTALLFIAYPVYLYFKAKDITVKLKGLHLPSLPIMHVKKPSLARIHKVVRIMRPS